MSRIEKIKELAKMRDEGILSDDEFQRMKTELIETEVPVKADPPQPVQPMETKSVSSAIATPLGYAAMVSLVSMFLPWMSNGGNGLAFVEVGRNYSSVVLFAYLIPAGAAYILLNLWHQKKLHKRAKQIIGLTPLILFAFVFVWLLSRDGKGPDAQKQGEIMMSILMDLGVGFWTAVISGVFIFLAKGPMDNTETPSFIELVDEFFEDNDDAAATVESQIPDNANAKD